MWYVESTVSLAGRAGSPLAAVLSAVSVSDKAQALTVDSARMK